MTRSSHPNKRDPRRLAPKWLAIGLASMLTGAWADMYRWVDENGLTVYSQQPPPNGDATQIRKEPAPRGRESARALERLKTQVEKDFDQREEAARLKEAADKKAREQAARRANCEVAKKNLDTLENLGAHRLTTPDGETRFLSEDERKPYIDEALKQIEANCN